MANFLEKIQRIWTSGNGKMIFAAVCAHSTSISIGFVQGYSAILIPQLVASKLFVLDSEQISWLASLGAVTNPIGSILSGLLAEWLGRTKSIQISTIPFILGWSCIACAQNIWMLYLGRLITGIAGGMSAACFTYVTEISTPQTRGILQSLGPVCASTGILLTYTLGYFISWDLVAIVSIFFALFTLTAMQFLPESPSYLIKKGKKEESLESLTWFRGTKTITELDLPMKETKNQYFTPAIVKPFFIIVSMFFLQSFSGIYSILFYAVDFFRDFEVDVNEHISSILVGVIRLTMAIFSAILISKLGRKTLCSISSLGMAISLTLAVAYLKYYESNPEQPRFFPIIPLLCILANIFFSMVGMLPIPWILAGELFPLRVRSIMSGVVICFGQCFIFITVKIYPFLVENLSFSGTLMTFIASSVVGVVFSKWVLLETKNKSLEEIETHFRSQGFLGRKGDLGVENGGFEGEVLSPMDLLKKQYPDGVYIQRG